jgi:hypothetical protein
VGGQSVKHESIVGIRGVRQLNFGGLLRCFGSGCGSWHGRSSFVSSCDREAAGFNGGPHAPLTLNSPGLVRFRRDRRCGKRCLETRRRGVPSASAWSCAVRGRAHFPQREPSISIVSPTNGLSARVRSDPGTAAPPALPRSGPDSARPCMPMTFVRTDSKGVRSFEEGNILECWEPRSVPARHTDRTIP